MEHIQTDHDGRLVFAAISRTALGTKGVRLPELSRFYARVSAFGVDRVFHLGGVNRGVMVDLCAVYPLVPGITTVETHGVASAARAARGGRTDWDTCPPKLPVLHGRSGAPLGHIVFCYDDAARSVGSVAGSCACRDPTSGLPEIVLVGGQREVEARRLTVNRGVIVGIGVFEARPRYRNPPDPFGGTIIKCHFSDTGELVECYAIFRDMSGGEKDVKPLSNGRRAA